MKKYSDSKTFKPVEKGIRINLKGLYQAYKMFDGKKYHRTFKTIEECRSFRDYWTPDLEIEKINESKDNELSDMWKALSDSQRENKRLENKNNMIINCLYNLRTTNCVKSLLCRFDFEEYREIFKEREAIEAKKKGHKPVIVISNKYTPLTDKIVNKLKKSECYHTPLTKNFSNSTAEVNLAIEKLLKENKIKVKKINRSRVYYV